MEPINWKVAEIFDITVPEDDSQNPSKSYNFEI
jgi:hypothetical protein